MGKEKEQNATQTGEQEKKINWGRNYKYFTNQTEEKVEFVPNWKRPFQAFLIGTVMLVVNFFFFHQGLLILCSTVPFGIFFLMAYGAINRSQEGIGGKIGNFFYSMMLDQYDKQVEIPDKDMDEELSREIGCAYGGGLQRLILDGVEVNTLQHVQISGPYHGQIATRRLVKMGKDEKVRSSNHEVSILYFGKSQLFTYRLRFSLIADEKSEEMNEYFYSDIVSVSTQVRTQPIKGLPQTLYNNALYFVLTTAAGSTTKFSYMDQGNIDNAVQCLKTLIRESKRKWMDYYDQSVETAQLSS